MSTDTPTTKPATLAEALSILQGRLPAVEKAQTATVPMKAGGTYRYSYADLATVSQAVLPLLSEVGLCFLAGPTIGSNGQFVLRWSLLHTSGEREDGEYPLAPGGSAQQRGSEITYARRYCLASVVGLSTVDDDGASASHPPAAPAARATRARKSAPAEETPPPAAEPTREGNGPRPLADSQRRKIMALWGQLSMSGEAFRAARLQLTSEWLGRPVASTNELTMREGAQLVGCLEARLAEPPAGHDDGPTA